MHLKSYQIDGRVLRTGAANFSASGLKHQDNDLIVIECIEEALAPDGIMERSSRFRLGFGPPPWISHAVVAGGMADQAIADLTVIASVGQTLGKTAALHQPKDALQST